LGKFPGGAYGLLGLLALGHVMLDGDVPGGCAIRVPDGSDPHLLVIEAAVLAPVGHFSVPDSAGKDGAPEFFVKRGGLAPRFQQACALPNGFLYRVSRQSGERWIYKLNLPARIGNDDGIRRLLHGFKQSVTFNCGPCYMQTTPRSGYAIPYLSATDLRSLGLF
jgi:hypothetical protein